MLTAPLKWHGGKSYLAAKIITLMPSRETWLHYVEPFFGGGQVLLALDPEGISEVVNDLNGELMNFWSVLADPTRFADFRRRIEARPFSEAMYQAVSSHRDWYGPYNGEEKFGVDCSVMDACSFFVLCRQSLSGRMKGFTAISRNRTRRGMNEQVSAWIGAVDGLTEVHTRLRRVLLLNRNALDVIREQDGPRTLFYLDPPYLHETRATTGEYAHEMSETDHSELLTTLNSIRGRFLLSGYHSGLYDNWAHQSNFTCHEFELPNNAAGGKEKRRMVECVWTNYDTHLEGGAA